MPTLFERLTSETGDEKLSIHALREVMRERGRGNITINEIVVELNLTDEQRDDFVAIGSKASTSDNKFRYFDMLFGFLVLGELGVKPSYYRNETEFWNRVNNEG